MLKSVKEGGREMRFGSLAATLGGMYYPPDLYYSPFFQRLFVEGS